MTKARLTIGLAALALACVTAPLVGCKREETPGGAGAGSPAAAAGEPKSELVLPEMDLSKLTPALETKIGAARREALRSPREVSKLVDLGALCYAHGMPKPAIACFQQALKVEPQEAMLWYCLGLCYEQVEDAGQALAAYEKVAELKPDNRPAHTRIAALIMDKEPERAAKMFASALEADPSDPIAHTGLAQRALAAGRYDDAGKHFREALKTAPNYGPAHLGLATVLTQQGKTAEAETQRRAAEGGERLRPRRDQQAVELLKRGLDVQTLINSALTATDRRQYAQAEQLLQQAIDVDESRVMARTSLGEVLGRQGKLDEAIRELERVLNEPEGKDYAPAKTKLAFALTVSGEYVRAEKLLREVLEKHPDDQEALRRFCALAIQEKTPDKALPVLETALTATPDNAELLVRAGEWYLQLGHEQKAIAALRKAAELSPDLPTVRQDLGVLLFRAGNVAGAREQFTAALQLDPRFTPARLALSDLLRTDKDFVGMVRLLREGLELVPNSPDLANGLAWYLATAADPQQRNAADAVSWAEKACNVTKRQDHALLDTLAAAYAAAGRFDDARKTIAEALKLAQAGGDAAAVKDYQTRQALYESDKPFFETN